MCESKQSMARLSDILIMPGSDTLEHYSDRLSDVLKVLAGLQQDLAKLQRSFQGMKVNRTLLACLMRD